MLLQEASSNDLWRTLSSFDYSSITSTSEDEAIRSGLLLAAGGTSLETAGRQGRQVTNARKVASETLVSMIASITSPFDRFVWFRLQMLLYPHVLILHIMVLGLLYMQSSVFC